MKIPSPRLPTPEPELSLFPTDKAGVMAIADAWYRPDRVAVNNDALLRLKLPQVPVGSESSMLGDTIPVDRQDRLARAIALNSLNYQFWDMREGEFIRYAVDGIVGAMGMKAAFEEGWAPGGPLDQARQGLRAIDAQLVREVFGDIPEVDSRVAVLRDVLAPGKLEALSRSLDAAIDAQGAIDPGLAARIAQDMPVAYGDPVLKKAQLALSEVWVQDRATGLDTACDLTAFADYQIPNILRAMGVLDYDPELAARIDRQELLPYGGEDECAIRAASLLAVDAIAAHQGVPVAAVDHYLWTRRKEAATPFHLTVTTAY